MPSKPDRFWSFFETTGDGESAEELHLLGYFVAIPSHLFDDPPIDGYGELWDREFCTSYYLTLPYNTIQGGIDRVLIGYRVVNNKSKKGVNNVSKK